MRIHSSREGRYYITILLKIFLKYFNPLIPQREVRQHCTKICHHILAVLPKTHLFSLSAAPKTLKIPRISRENNLYPGANPPHFLCELPVRTITRLVIHNHLLLSYCITPFESKLVKNLIGIAFFFKTFFIHVFSTPFPSFDWV